jgi:hypothetical protein
MATKNVTRNVSLNGTQYQEVVVSAAFGVVTNVPPVTLNAAKVGALTTRTSDSVGVLTMNTGHGLVDGIIDLYWDIGGTKGCRRNITADVTADSIAISDGTGDVLPADESAITAVHPSTETVSMNGDNLKIIAAKTNRDSHCCISFGTETTAYVEGGCIELNDGTFGRGRVWESQTGGTNPIADANNFTTLKLSQAGTVAATVQLDLAGE